MKIVNDDTALRIVASTRAIALFALALGAYYLGDLVFLLAVPSHPRMHHEILGLSMGASICTVAFILFSRLSDFRFDKYARKLIWRRGILFISELFVAVSKICEAIADRIREMADRRA